MTKEEKMMWQKLLIMFWPFWLPLLPIAVPVAIMASPGILALYLGNYITSLSHEWKNEKKRCAVIVERLAMLAEPDFDGSIMDLSGLGLCDRDVSKLQILFDYLKNDTSIKELNLGNNNLSYEAVKLIAELLRDNHSLQKLYLNNNSLTDEEVLVIAGSLAVNKGLVELDLNNNELGNLGIRYVLQHLEHNYTLQKLNIKYTSRGIYNCYKLNLKSLQYSERVPVELLLGNPSLVEVTGNIFELNSNFHNIHQIHQAKAQAEVLLKRHRTIRDQKDEFIRQVLTFHNGSIPLEIIGNILSFNISVPEQQVQACISFIDQEYYAIKATLNKDYGPYPLLVQNQGQFRLFKPLDTAKQVAHFERAIKSGHLSWLRQQINNGYHTTVLALYPSDYWLDLAGKYQQLEVLEYLLDQGFGYSGAGECLIHLAARYGYVQALASYFAETDIHEQDEYGNTPLHIALMHQQLACANYLLAQGADLYCPNIMEETPSNIAAEQHLVLTEARQLASAQLTVSNLKLNPTYF